MKKAKMKAPTKTPKSDMPMPAPIDGSYEDDQEPKDYEVKDAVDTLTRAEDIKANKKLMPHVQKHIAKKISSLKDLKDLAYQKSKPKEESE